MTRPTEEKELKEMILSVLSPQRGLTFSEIVQALSWTGDKRPLRKALGDLVREGKVLREPDYERKRMVFRRAP
ncbi:MAG: hypothetical protein ACP5FT_00815 [Acidilobus sp.]